MPKTAYIPSNTSIKVIVTGRSHCHGQLPKEDGKISWTTKLVQKDDGTFTFAKVPPEEQQASFKQKAEALLADLKRTLNKGDLSIGNANKQCDGNDDVLCCITNADGTTKLAGMEVDYGKVSCPQWWTGKEYPSKEDIEEMFQSVNESFRKFNESRNEVKDENTDEVDYSKSYSLSSPIHIANGHVHTDIPVFYRFDVENTEIARYHAYGETPIVTMMLRCGGHTLDVVHYATDEAKWLEEIDNDVTDTVILELARSGKLEEVRDKVFELFPTESYTESDEGHEQPVEGLTYADVREVMNKVAKEYDISVESATFNVLSNGRATYDSPCIPKDCVVLSNLINNTFRDLFPAKVKEHPTQLPEVIFRVTISYGQVIIKNVF